MPKETINSPVGPYYAKVGWDPAGFVQVGVEAEPGALFALLFDVKARQLLAYEVSRIIEARTEDRTGLDEAIGDAVIAAMNAVTNGGYAGVWAGLDRQGCNHLIRILRRARDAAFGRDE